MSYLAATVHFSERVPPTESVLAALSHQVKLSVKNDSDFPDGWSFLFEEVGYTVLASIQPDGQRVIVDMDRPTQYSEYFEFSLLLVLMKFGGTCKVPIPHYATLPWHEVASKWDPSILRVR